MTDRERASSGTPSGIAWTTLAHANDDRLLKVGRSWWLTDSSLRSGWTKPRSGRARRRER